MYSSLYYQESLKQVRLSSLILRKLLEKSNLKTPRPHYLLVRNPYEKLESFFLNKFRKNIRDSEIVNWEHCQQIFFEPLGISQRDANTVINAKFLAVSFEEFMELLPDVYQKDGHLIPQSYSNFILLKKGKVSVGKWPLQYDRFFKIEEAVQLEELCEKIGIQLKKPLNTTKDLYEAVHWSPRSRTIAEALYKQDFHQFGYAVIPSN